MYLQVVTHYYNAIMNNCRIPFFFFFTHSYNSKIFVGFLFVCRIHWLAVVNDDTMQPMAQDSSHPFMLYGYIEQMSCHFFLSHSRFMTDGIFISIYSGRFSVFQNIIPTINMYGKLWLKWIIYTYLFYFPLFTQHARMEYLYYHGYRLVAVCVWIYRMYFFFPL